MRHASGKCPFLTGCDAPQTRPRGGPSLAARQRTAHVSGSWRAFGRRNREPAERLPGEGRAFRPGRRISRRDHAKRQAEAGETRPGCRHLVAVSPGLPRRGGLQRALQVCVGVLSVQSRRPLHHRGHDQEKQPDAHICQNGLQHSPHAGNCLSEPCQVKWERPGGSHCGPGPAADPARQGCGGRHRTNTWGHRASHGKGGWLRPAPVRRIDIEAEPDRPEPQQDKQRAKNPAMTPQPVTKSRQPRCKGGPEGQRQQRQ